MHICYSRRLSVQALLAGVQHDAATDAVVALPGRKACLPAAVHACLLQHAPYTPAAITAGVAAAAAAAAAVCSFAASP
jgi:hypothetical protein